MKETDVIRLRHMLDAASQPVGQASLLVMSGKDAQPTKNIIS